MAIVLKDKPRAELRPEFWDAIRPISQDIGMDILDRIRGARSKKQAKHLSKRYAPLLLNLQKARNKNPKLETRLIHSNWTTITGRLTGTMSPCLEFIKESAIMRPIRQADRYATWEIGDYHCIVPVDAFGAENVRPSRIRFKPRIGIESEEGLHPHQTERSTCWGSYATWTVQSLKTFNIADLQDAMYKFLTHYTPGDTLTRPRHFHWYKQRD